MRLLNTAIVTAHLVSADPTPGCTKGSGAGSTGTATVSGTDTDGVVTIVAGGITSAAALATLAFGLTPAAAPQGVTLTAKNANAAGKATTIYADTYSTSGWVLQSNGTLTSGQTYLWAYHVGF